MPGLLLALHAPPVEELARRRLVAWLASEDGIDARIERLDYDLLRLRIRATGVHLAARDAPERPFLEARLLSVALPARALAGRLALEEVRLEDARVSLVRGESGELNLPGGSGPTPEIELGSVLVSGLDVVWEDRTAGVVAAIRQARLSLPGGAEEGTLALPRLEVGAAGGTLTGRASARVGLEDGRLRVRGLELELETDRGRLGGDLEVDVFGEEPQLRLGLRGRIDSEVLRPWTSSLWLPEGPVTVTASASGSRAAPRVELTVRGDELLLASAGRVALEADLRHEAGVSRLVSLELTGLGGTVRADGELDWREPGPGRLAVDARGIALERAAALAGLGPAPALGSRLDADLRLSWAEPAVHAVSGSLALRVAPESSAALSGAARVDLDGRRFQAALGLDLPTAALRLDASGTLDEAAIGRSALEGRVDVELRQLANLPTLLRAVGVEEAPPGALSGRVAIAGALDGTLGRPRLRGAATAEALGLAGLGPYPSRVELALDPDRLEVHRATLGDGANRWTASGRLALGSGRLEARVSGELGDLPALAAALPAARTLEAGTARIEARLEGAATSPAIEGRVELRDVRATGWALKAARLRVEKRGAESVLELLDLEGEVGRAAVGLARSGRATWTPGGLAVDGLDLRFGGSSRLLLEGELSGEGVLATLRSRAEDLRSLLPWTPARVCGRVDARLRARGTIDRLSVEGRVETPGLRIGLPGRNEAATLAGALRLGEGVVALEHLEADWAGVRARASGRLPLRLASRWLPEPVNRGLPPVEGGASLDAALAATAESLAALGGSTLPEGAEGAVEARLRAEASQLDLGSLRARLDLDRASFGLPTARLDLAGPAAVVVEDGALRLTGFTWQGPDGRLSLTGAMALESRRAEVGLQGALDLRLFDAFFPMAAAGRLELDLDLDTDLDERAELLGRVAVRDGGFAMRDPAVDVSALQVRVELEEDRIRLGELSASVNGGSLEASGEVVLEGERSWALDARGRALGLVPYPDLRSEIDLDLALRGDFEDATLGGKVDVVHADYRGPRSLYRVYSDLESRWAGGSAAPFLERLGLDVAIASRHDATWSNAFGRLAARIDLALRGTAAAPALDGFVALRPGGDVTVGGTVVDIRAGSLDFAEATGVEPQIGLSAEARVSRYDVELRATGVPGDLELNLSSQPPLPESDLVALLATGAASSDSESDRAAATGERAVATASRTALGGLTELLGVRQLRVSDAPISAFEPRDESRLTVSVQLSRAFEVVHSQTLSQSGQTAEGAIWHPFPRVDASLYTISNDWFLELQHRIELGRSGRAVAPPPPEAAPRVVAVDVRGAGRYEAALREVARVRAGDRFDYFRWQEDRERMRRFLRERGHREARIRASRREVDGERVRLGFDVDPGPTTRLRIEGGGLDESDRRALEAAWTWTPSDRQLRSDLERTARVALTRKGYAEAVVEARIATGVGPQRVKELLIRCEPGERAALREIVFPGARAVSSGTLGDVVEAAGLAVRGFVERAALEAAITDYYATLGHLTARARAAPPEIRDGVAQLEVHVDEGPAFHVASVDLGIPPRLSAVAGAPALDLAPGAAYRPAAEVEAQLALERHYRAAGFNDARVETTRRTDAAAATVSLTFDLRAGTRQVVADVAFEGDATPTPGVRERLEEQTGGPASRAAWLPAQRDILRTGLYRDVKVAFEPIGEGGADEAVLARVALEPWPRWSFEYGARVEERSTQSGRRAVPAVRASAERRNPFGLPLTARIEGALTSEVRGGLAELNFGRFLGHDVLTRLYYFFAHADLDVDEIPDENVGLTSFDLVSQEIVAEQRWRRGRREISYGYRLSDLDFTLAAEDLPEPVTIGQRLARPNAALLIDQRDDPLDARRGWFHSSSLEFGFSAIGSDVDFAKYLGKVYGYRPTGGIVLAGGLRAGIGTGLRRLQNPLNSLGFTAGGSTTVRGYREDTLAPTNALGIRGGSALLILNAEARFPILPWLGGAVFVDAGNVWEHPSDASLSDLQLGLGGGLRLQLPFLTLRLDLAFPTPRRPEDPRYRFHFGIGQAF